MSIGVMTMLASWFFLLEVLRQRGLRLRRAFLITSFVWGTAVTILTEGLSLFNQLNYTSLLTCWITLLIPLFYLYFSGRRLHKQSLLEDCLRENKAILLSIAIILFSTFCIAVIAPPNNNDSMTYHMSRVMHWIQNNSVAHYPTNILRQIELNPWAEFAITHLQILSGGDYLANLVQWFCMVGSILGITLIAEKLGASNRVQMIAALVTATIPMGILQSSSTQNDLVVSFWLVCLAYFCMQFNEKPCWSYAVAVGSSLGLSLLTKGTAYLFASPLIIWLAISSLKSIKQNALKFLVFIMLSASLLNIGHYIRNYETFGNILSSGESKYTNDSYGIATLASNIIRNIALEMSSQSVRVNQAVESGANVLHTLMGLDINDSGTTWGSEKFELNGTISEDDLWLPIVVCLFKWLSR